MRARRSSKVNGARTTPFTLAMWNRWLNYLNGPDSADPQYQYLARGIDEFRQRLAEKEPLENA